MKIYRAKSDINKNTSYEELNIFNLSQSRILQSSMIFLIKNDIHDQHKTYKC